jgi:dihydroorotate dehydrogenase electron transfer subunit
MIQDITTPVTRNDDLGGGNHLLEFEAPGSMIGDMGSAQFFMIGVPGSDVLLRRPFSVCGLPGTFTDGRPGAAQVLYKVYGRGTALLATLEAGAEITVLGRLGRGFEPPADPDAVAVFVAGGIGSAPFPLLIDELRRAGHPAPMMFYGARGSGDLPLVDWFDGHVGALHVATEDGSAGTHGRVTEPLLAWHDKHRERPQEWYVCGPDPMLKAVARTALDRRVPAQLALEAHMACGFGVCIGCVVPCRAEDGGIRYDRVCVEGPVMRAERMAW